MRWGLDDEVDRRLAVRAHLELAKLHRAAGADQIYTLHAREIRWRQGDDFDEYLGRLESAGPGPSCYRGVTGSAREWRGPTRASARRSRPGARGSATPPGGRAGFHGTECASLLVLVKALIDRRAERLAFGAGPGAVRVSIGPARYRR